MKFFRWNSSEKFSNNKKGDVKYTSDFNHIKTDTTILYTVMMQRLYFFLCLFIRRRFLRLCLFIFAFLFFLTLDIKPKSFQKGISIFRIHNMNPAT